MKDILQCCCTLTDSIIPDLHSRGIRNIEMHLLKMPTIEDLKLFESSSFDCYSVHTPIAYDTNGGRELNLNECYDSNVYYSLYQTCLLAESISCTKNHSVVVVVHNVEPSYMYKHATEFRKIIIDGLRRVHSRCPDVRLAIENVTPVSNMGTLNNGIFLTDIAKICDIINEELEFKFAGICLDLCHYMTTVRFLKDALRQSKMSNAENNFPEGSLSLAYQLESAGDYLLNVHVSSACGLSDTGETHAYQITTSDIPMLRLLNSGWKSSKRLFSVEVREDNWDIRENAQEALRILSDVLGE